MGSGAFPAVVPANPAVEVPRESDTMPSPAGPVAGGLGRHSPVVRELRGIHQRATACAAFSASAGSTSVRPRALAPPQSPPAVRFMGGKPYYANCFYEPEVGLFMIHSCLVAVCPVSARQGALLVSARLNVTFHADHACPSQVVQDDVQKDPISPYNRQNRHVRPQVTVRAR